MARETTQLPGHVSQDVHWERTEQINELNHLPTFFIHFPLLIPPSPTWVRNHQQDAVGAVLDDVGDDKLEDVHVALHQVQTALALLLAGTSSHNYHLGVGCHTVV